MIVELSVDVYCDIEGSQYRVYVNDDLLTERTFLFGPENYVREMIVVNVSTEVNTVRVVPLNASNVVASNLQVPANSTSKFTLA